MGDNSLSEQVYRRIRKKIIQLEYEPGANLSETQLAKEFGVSRAPIHVALARLQSENLIEVRPQIGTKVKRISVEEAKSILEIRLLIEPYASRIAAEKIEDEDKQMLNDKFRILEESDVNFLKKEQVANIDSLLHTTIWRLCGNPEIVSILSSYSDRIMRLQLTTALYAHRLAPSANEMISIKNALLMNDPSLAEKSMYKHIYNFMLAILNLFAHQNSGDYQQIYNQRG